MCEVADKIHEAMRIADERSKLLLDLERSVAVLHVIGGDPFKRGAVSLRAVGNAIHQPQDMRAQFRVDGVIEKEISLYDVPLVLFAQHVGLMNDEERKKIIKEAIRRKCDLVV